jgi:PAS domain S-box-containing protein
MDKKTIKWHVFEQLPSGIISISADGLVEYMNPQAQKFLSLGADGWRNQSINRIFRLYSLIEKKPIAITYDDIKKGHELYKIPDNTGLLNENGEVVPIRGQVSLFKELDSVETLVVSFTLDECVLEMRNKVEVEKNNFKMLFDYAPQGMMSIDQNYRIMNINEAAADIFNISVSEAFGQQIGDSFGCMNFLTGGSNCYESNTHACKSCIFINSIKKVLKNGTRVNGIEFRFDYQNEAFEVIRSWLKISVVPMVFSDELSALVVIEDVTLHRELAKNLIRNERRLRLITDNMIDTITQINSEGVIEFATPSCWHLLGITPENLVGKSFKDFVYPEDLSAVHELFKKRFMSKEAFSSRLRLVRKDKSVLWIEANGSIIDDEQRDRTVVYVIRDVTEEERYKSELEKSREEAISASKSKSEFLANMSHEIRTPMNGIIGMTNITLMDRLSDEQRENMTMVKNSAVSLLGIINSILDFSKIEAGKLELEKSEFDLKGIVSRAVNPLIIAADQKGIDLEVSYDSNVHKKLIGDAGRISQILNNLIYNAIKFTENGGVYVHFGTVETREGIIELRGSVRDTGIGIPESEITKLFESFHQVDGSMTRKYGGTGLGLAITKSLIDRMNGCIEVNSVLDKGSIFSFQVELKKALLEKRVKPDQVALELPKADVALDILLVEDDLINRKMTNMILEKQGHRVLVAINGREAVEIFDKEKFDIILMDIQMPEMDGIKASKIIKKKCKENNTYVPIIALTAHAIDGDEERFIAEGMDDYISKPIDLVQFFDVIKRNIGKEEVMTKALDADIQAILEKVHMGHIKESNRLQADEEGQAMFGRILKFFRIIDQGLREHDFEVIESSAHRLKNLLAEIGYSEERKLTFKLELAARKSDIITTLDLYKELKVCFNFENKE